MIKKIPPLFLLIFIFIISSCEDYYNFEAKKLDTKASKLIEEANTSAFKIDEKIILFSEVLNIQQQHHVHYLNSKFQLFLC